MKVYVVESGEQHHGGGVESIHDTENKATASALSMPCHSEGGWNWKGTDPYDLYWENGCDYVLVREFEVK